MRKICVSTFEEAEDYINQIPRFGAKHTVEDTAAFLEKLGSPDRSMKIIHVAGTNGKGSVCAYMRNILESAGYRVAVFTSPHLVDIRERFVWDGKMISREDFLEVFLLVYQALDWQSLERDQPGAYHPSYFEYLFLMAMLYFARQKPDYCILETGLGGRLDATNAVFHKELSVITRIGLDHTEYLGETMEKIAWEKAGIMRRGAPAVCWDTNPGTKDVFSRKASELGIPAVFVSKKDYTFGKFKKKTIDFSLRTGYYGYISLTLHTIAVYQMENASLAVRAIETLDGGKTVSADQIRAGVESCFWAGRMEEVLPEVYVDGAHNEDGIRAFLETVALDGVKERREAGQEETGQKETGEEEAGQGAGRSLLFAAVKDKDCRSMTAELAASGLFDRIAIARLKTGRTSDPMALKEMFPPCCFPQVSVYESAEEAFRSLLSGRKDGERVYVAGSLYLAGEIKELISRDKF